MRITIFGLTVSSSWGNGHATTWRGVLRGLHAAGHRVTFFERDVPYYAAQRDLPDPPFADLVLYTDWAAVRGDAQRTVAESDVAIVTSYCPDGLDAARLVLDQHRALRAFYDIDTPVTLAALAADGIAVQGGARYLTPELIPEYDLYLSFSGGAVLDELRTRWGARRALPLYCSVDPAVHGPVPADERFRCVLGYLGTYSTDRQPGLERLLLGPAERRRDARFWVVGSLYPPEVRWPPNVAHHDHLPPQSHPGFYCANRLTLNITRQAMVAAGHSPSVRVFEAASCGTPIVTDRWPGLETFFTPGKEILVADHPADVLEALARDDAELDRLARAALERVLGAHTATHRAAELVVACEAAAAGH